MKHQGSVGQVEPCMSLLVVIGAIFVECFHRARLEKWKTYMKRMSGPDTEMVVCAEHGGDQVRVHLPKQRSQSQMSTLDTPVFYTANIGGQEACNECGTYLATHDYDFSSNFVCTNVGDQYHLRGCSYSHCSWRDKPVPTRALPPSMQKGLPGQCRAFCTTTAECHGENPGLISSLCDKYGASKEMCEGVNTRKACGWKYCKWYENGGGVEPKNPQPGMPAAMQLVCSQWSSQYESTKGDVDKILDSMENAFKKSCQAKPQFKPFSAVCKLIKDESACNINPFCDFVSPDSS